MRTVVCIHSIVIQHIKRIMCGGWCAGKRQWNETISFMNSSCSVKGKGGGGGDDSLTEVCVLSWSLVLWMCMGGCYMNDLIFLCVECVPECVMRDSISLSLYCAHFSCRLTRTQPLQAIVVVRWGYAAAGVRWLHAIWSWVVMWWLL